MNHQQAVTALGALAQDSRLSVFKMLVREGETGLPAGQIAHSLGIPHNTLSSHLNNLSHSGLVQSRRQGRSIIYSLNVQQTRELLAFLIDDCCGGAPELCDVALNHIQSSEPLT